MKKLAASHLFASVILFISLVTAGCNKKDTTWPNDTQPENNITITPSGSIFMKGDSVEISIELSDEIQHVEYVGFLIDDEIRRRNTESPYHYLWDTSYESNGTHTIRVILGADGGEIPLYEIDVELTYRYIVPENIGDGWETSSLTDQNVESYTIDYMMNNPVSEIDFLYSLLIIKNEKLVFEEYFNRQNRDDANDIASDTKSFTSTLIGIALEEGLINNLGEKMVDYFPEFVTQDMDLRKHDVTLRHLISMRAGYPNDSNEILFPGVYNSENWIQYMIDIPLIRDPGSGWDYSSASVHILSGVLTKASGMSTMAFAEQYLFEPLGIQIAFWARDPQGYYFGHADMYMTPRNMAKLGYLYLQEGVINGQQVWPESWIEDATTFHSVMPWGGGIFNKWGYGYLWWLWRVYGHHAFFAGGQGGQFIIVIPDLNSVIVTTAKTAVISVDDLNLNQAEQQQNLLYQLIGEYIIAALE